MSEDLNNMVNETSETRIVSLDADKFSTLLDVFSSMGRSLHSNLIIKKGKVCQMNDRRAAIFSIDLTPLIGDVELILSGLAVRVDLLTPFKNSDMSIIIEEERYIFKDQYSAFEFAKPIEQYITDTNYYLSENDFAQKLNMNDEGELFSIEAPKFILDRLGALSKALGEPVVQIDFMGDKALFKVMSKNDVNTIVGKLLEIDLNRPMEGKANVTIHPFLFSDQTVISCYKQRSEDGLIFKLVSTFDEEINLKAEIWLPSILETEEELVNGDETDTSRI